VSACDNKIAYYFPHGQEVLMDADIISFESMLAAQQGADWAFWAMLGTWFSGIVTLVAALVAFKALQTWKQQEKHNEKKSLKVALISYRNLLAMMPDKLCPHDPDCRQPALSLQDSMNQIYLHVTLMEVMLDTDDIGQQFYALYNRHGEYMQGKVTKDKVADLLIPFIAKPFISGMYNNKP
jgi:hypothetical protein